MRHRYASPFSCATPPPPRADAEPGGRNRTLVQPSIMGLSLSSSLRIGLLSAAAGTAAGFSFGAAAASGVRRTASTGLRPASLAAQSSAAAVSFKDAGLCKKLDVPADLLEKARSRTWPV